MENEMTNPFLGEIRMFAGPYAPKNWLPCDGQVLPIELYQSLFTLIGTTYGGDGRLTFALPDMRGRVPIHQGAVTGLSPRALGRKGGREEVTLRIKELAAHTHDLNGNNAAGTSPEPAGRVPAQMDGLNAFASSPSNRTLAVASIMEFGPDQPHDNMMPALCVNFIIATEGTIPQRS